MAFKDADEFHHEIAEWFDHEGNYHQGHPSVESLLDDAVEIVIHAWDDAGNDVYWTAFSEDGWEEGEYLADVEDGYNHYIGRGK